MFVLHEEIDLGSHVIGIFSTREKAHIAKQIYFDWYNKRHGFDARLFIEENDVDSFSLGYGNSQEIINV